jgi:hypothetical protein
MDGFKLDSERWNNEQKQDDSLPKTEPVAESKEVKNHKTKKKFLNNKKALFEAIGTALIIVLLAGLAIQQHIENQRLRSPEAAQELAQKQVETLVEKVSKHIQLPDGTPAVATVDDKNKLNSQVFFDNAENGDKVLIFSAAGKAVIYRESEDRIINFGPVEIDTSNELIETTQE